jgi:hypothetical protein
MVHKLPCCGSSEIERPLDPGWIDWMPELPRTLTWLRWRTSWHASHGPTIEEKTIDHYRASLQRERADPVTAPYQRILSIPHRTLHRNSKDERTVTMACLQPDPENGLQRPTCKNRHAAELIMARRDDLHSKAEYIAADLSIA